jgi:head-tail adaptor
MSLNPRLRRRLVLEAPVAVADGAGGSSVAWQPLGALWAEVTARSGREDFVAAQVRPRLRYRIIVRGSPVGAPSRPRPDQRLRDGARVFAILTVAEADPAGRYLEITAEEGVLP